jgi:hypothetical protein
MTALVVEMLSILEDRQVLLYDPAWASLTTYDPEFFTNCDSALLLDYLSPEGFQWMQQDIWGYCLAGGDSIPYFVFTDWDNELNLSLLDNVLFPLRDSPGIILDVRLCEGGSRDPESTWRDVSWISRNRVPDSAESRAEASNSPIRSHTSDSRGCTQGAPWWIWPGRGTRRRRRCF